MAEGEEFNTKNTIAKGIFETFQQVSNMPRVIKEYTASQAEWHDGTEVWTKKLAIDLGLFWPRLIFASCLFLVEILVILNA